MTGYVDLEQARWDLQVATTSPPTPIMCAIMVARPTSAPTLTGP